MQEFSQKAREKIKNTCDQCGKEINEDLSKVFKITNGIMKKNVFSGNMVRYYHMECLRN